LARNDKKSFGIMTAFDDLPLAADFAPATQGAWRKLVDGVLKGAPFEKLESKTYDGLKIEPIYARAEGASPIVGRAAATPWQIMQRIDHPDPAKANAQALHDLENGARGLSLVFAGANGARGFGLPASAEAVEQALAGIRPDAGISLDIELGTPSRMAAIHVAEWIKRSGVDPARCDVRFGLDPIGACAVRGSSMLSLAEMASGVTNAIKGFSALGFKGPLDG
jgi:methylmalonyl-CoA mutase